MITTMTFSEFSIVLTIQAWLSSLLWQLLKTSSTYFNINHHAYRSSIFLLKASSFWFGRWFFEFIVVAGFKTMLFGAEEGFHDPINGCSPGFKLLSLLSFFLEMSTSEVVAEYECRGCETHGMDKLSLDEKKPCWLILCPIFDRGIICL